MNETASDPAVPVEERMDRLELRVCHSSLSHSRHIVAVDKFAKITQQPIYLILRWRNEFGAER